MIVLPVGVAGDFGGFRVCLFFIGKVIECQANKRLRAWHQQARINPHIEVVCHVAHAAVTAFGKPGFQALCFHIQALGAGEADKLKAQAVGFGADEVGIVLGVFHGERYADGRQRRNLCGVLAFVIGLVGTGNHVFQPIFVF